MGLFGFSPDSTTTEEKLKAGIVKQSKGKASGEVLEAIYEGFCQKLEGRLQDAIGREKYGDEFRLSATSIVMQRMTPEEGQKASVMEPMVGAIGSNGIPKRWEILTDLATAHYGSPSEANSVIKALWESFKTQL